MVRYLPALIVLAIDIYALVDVLSSHEWRIKTLNKFAWVVIILLLPLIGAILWFTLGRERTERPDQGTFGDPRRSSAPVGPDDDPVFLRNATRFEEQEARIRKLEEELKALDDDKPKE
jgi:hypothetical protein